MSKCRPEAGMEFMAIADFLRSVHVNGQPLELPTQIENLHVHPRLSLNLAKTMNTESMERTAAAFDVAESSSERMHTNVEQKLADLDERLAAILSRLEKSEQ